MSPESPAPETGISGVDHVCVFLILQLMHLLFPWTCMLIPLLPPLCLLTGSSHRLKKITHNPNKVTRKDKRGTRAYLDPTEDGHLVQRDRGAAAREAARQKAEEEFLAQERAKKAKFDNLTTLSGLNKSEVRAMRSQPFFNMPRNSPNPRFWRKEQEVVFNEVYARLSGPNIVCVQKVLNLSALSTKPYFQEAVWIVRKLGLER